MYKSKRCTNYRKAHHRKRKTVKRYINRTGGGEYKSVPLKPLVQEGGQQQQEPKEGEEEKKSVSSVLGNVLSKGMDRALNLIGYEKSKPTPPEPPSQNPIVVGASNAAKNLSNAATSAMTEGINIVQEKLSNPETVAQLEKTIDLAAPVASKVLDKSVDMLAKEGPKIAAAVEDIGANFAKSIPYVGAVVALGSELNDVQAIAASTTKATNEITETLAEGITEATDAAHDLSSTADMATNITTGAENIASLGTTNINHSNQTIGGGKVRLKDIQRAGAKINNRIKSSMKHFHSSSKHHKTHKRVRFQE